MLNPDLRCKKATIQIDSKHVINGEYVFPGL